MTVKDTEALVAEAGTATERVTVPVRPLLLSPMVVIATLPATKGGGLVGDELIVKSGFTVTWTLTVWGFVPAIVPVITTV